MQAYSFFVTKILSSCLRFSEYIWWMLYLTFLNVFEQFYHICDRHWQLYYTEEALVALNKKQNWNRNLKSGGIYKSCFQPW